MATRDYTLGKGKVLFKPTGEAAYIDLGNAPAFTINLAVEKLEHFSSRSGLSVKDLEVITKLGMGGSFTLDEPNANNLSMFVMSDMGAEAGPQTAGSTAASSIANIVLDRWYPMTLAGTGTAAVDAAGVAADENLGTSTLALTGTSAAVTMAHEVRALILTSGTTGTFKLSVDGSAWGTTRTLTPVATTDGTYTCVAGDGELEGIVLTFDEAAGLAAGDIFSFNIAYDGASRLTNLTAATVSGSVENTDFVLDYKAGLFMALGTGNIVPDSTVAFATTTYGANADRVTTKGGTLNSLKGDLYFVGDPPVGRILDIQGYCSITPNGDFSLIGADWMQMQFSVEFLKATDVSDLVTVTDRGKA